MNLRTVHEQLAAAAAAALPELRSYDHVPANPQLPCVVVPWPRRIVYDTTLGGGADIDQAVTIVLPATDIEAAQHTLDGLLSSPGLANAIATHDTDAWRALRCTGVDEIGPLQIGKTSTLAADVMFTIHT